MWELVNGSWYYDDGSSNGNGTTNATTTTVYPSMNVTRFTPWCTRNGEDGSVRIETQFGSRFSIDDGEGVGNNDTPKGAYGTRHSLMLESDNRPGNSRQEVRSYRAFETKHSLL